ncbi:MAG: aspartate--tRNA ligase, partial [Solirubrobacteraceae bacterium]
MKGRPQPNAYRDTWCGELRSTDAGTQARVAGWVHRIREHGGIVFVDLRDRSGLVQLVIDREQQEQAHSIAHQLRPEFVVSAQGNVVLRDPKNTNPNIPTGEIEIDVADLALLSEAQTPPIPVDEDVLSDEVARLRHRPVDLRRAPMREALILRHELVNEIRTALDENDFLEIETPILTRSTPEGARDFLVPSRVNPGCWYALPQSPQLFKQLLMIGGYERYYQIARCFRDEDLRADRQPEFTQLDIEMSFVSETDVIALTELVMARVFKRAGLELPPPPWRQLSYDEAMLRYGSDRPDLRFALEISDVSEQLRGSQFKVFESVLGSGGTVRALNAGKHALSRAELESLNDVVAIYGAKGVAPIPVGQDGQWTSTLAKFFTPEQAQAVNESLAAKEGDLLLFVADSTTVAQTAIGALREHLGERFGLIEDSAHEILWVIDFPMFGWEERVGGWTPLHHPFTAPASSDDQQGTLALDDPGSLRSRAYDLVLDGVELGGGSMRIHDRQLQLQVLRTLGIDEQEAERRFGFLLRALGYG